jgi:putative transposase
VEVPWTGFDLINVFNRWKKSEAAGRVFAVSTCGIAEVKATGLKWRNQVCQQAFEGAAVDCGRALGACQIRVVANGRAAELDFRSSRKNPAAYRRFGCAINKPRATNP